VTVRRFGAAHTSMARYVNRGTTYRLALSVLGVGMVLAIAGRAAAQGVDEFGMFGQRQRGVPAESPQNAAFEFRIGRYVPSIDSEFQTAKPYEQTFGDKNRYSVGFEVDWQALRIPYLGTLGPGVGFAYTKISAQSFVASDPTLQTRSGPGEVSSLTIFPMYAVAVLRADYLARQVKIPIVPYGKLGLGAAFWSIGNGDGTARQNGVVGRGLSYGPQFALGAMLLLDALDPTSAIEMDANTGVNNSYFFVEWYVSQLNGFGSGGQMQVGTNTWVLGLALEI
jgi:hypothetical protein